MSTPVPIQYYVHNTTRNPATRHLRRAVPGPESSTKNLFIGGVLRVVRGRPMPITEKFLRQHRKELADKEAKGLLAVYTHNSLRVNLETIEPVPNSPPPPAPEPEDVSEAPEVLREETPTPVEVPLAELKEETKEEDSEEIPYEEPSTSDEVPEPSVELPTREDIVTTHGRKRRNR